MLEKREKTGTVVVAGGGIAALQASLDLAEMGYTVHLLERFERIGGSISPEGDEMLCLLSHKVVEITSQPRIDLMTRSEVVEVTGEPGRMKARIRRMNPAGEREEISLDCGAVILGSDRLSPGSQNIAEELGLLEDPEGSMPLSTPNPMATSRPGIYACRVAASEQKGFHLLLLEASAAAGMAAEDLQKAGFSPSADPPFPEIPDRSTEPPRLGLFLCECACRMAGVSDLHPLLKHSSSLPFMMQTQSFPLACAPEAQERLRDAAREHRLNRVVVVCSQWVARSLFLRALQQERIDSHLFHPVRLGRYLEAKEGTPSLEKAKGLLKSAILKAALQQPRVPTIEPVVKAALVVGGGVAGVVAALSTAKQGYKTYLVEKEAALDGSENPLLKDEADFLDRKIQDLRNESRVEIHLSSEVLETKGYVGSFLTRIRAPKGEISLLHGIAILSGRASREQPEKAGSFFAGAPDASRSMREAVVRARAAAARASAILSKDRILVRGVAPAVSRGKCAACLTCVRTCPCGVPYVDERGCACIEPAVCKGCGICMTECPGQAISLQQFSDEEMREKLEMSRCSSCGQPYLSLGRIEYLKRKLSAEDLQPLHRQLCPDCLRKAFAKEHFVFR